MTYNAGLRARARGVEQYPFDPLLQPADLEGLDRLRCIADRRYAATLYEIYVLAERNESVINAEEQRAAEAAERTAQVRDHLRQLARRAFSGSLGTEAQELARFVLSNRDGAVGDEDRALAELGRALAELGAV